MGRIRQRIIKNTAFELLRDYGDRFTKDFKHNREVVKELVGVEGSVMRNRIAGFVTRLKRREEASKEPG